MSERIVSVESGGDWNDASYALLLVPPEMDLKEEHGVWRTWYREVLTKGCSKLCRYLSFDEWLVCLGARRCPHETFGEDNYY